MALKSAQPGDAEKSDVEEVLDYIDKTIDRIKTLYEQYFLGIQKQPPTHMHADVERRFRDLTRVQIRNTGLRYRFATLQQKFGAYNSYWRRTLRQIENGTYIRTLQKLSRRAAETGEEIPDEILAAMPKRMREQVKRDREVALASARRRDQAIGDSTDPSFTLPPGDGELRALPPEARRGRDGAFALEDDGDFDVDAFFASVTSENPVPPPAPAGSPSRAPAPRAEPAASSAFGDDTQENAIAYEEPTPVPQRPSTVAVPGRRTAPRIPVAGVRTTGSMPVVPSGPEHPRAPTPVPASRTTTTPPPPQRTGALPRLPTQPPPPSRTDAVPRAGTAPGAPAPSQVTRPNPIQPGMSQRVPAVPVATLSGPFPRAAPPVSARPAPAAAPRPAPPRATAQAPARPPPGMNDADVNALHAKYVQAKRAVGQDAGPGSYGKLLKTINAQAPRIMEQYKAKGVEFSVVVKDNQVVLKAKPKP